MYIFSYSLETISCKTQELINFFFLKNDKNSKIAEMVQGSLENFLDLG